MLRNMLGQIFDSTLARFLIQHFSHVRPFFPFSNYAETIVFIGFQQNPAYCSPPPPKLGTLFVNTAAQIEIYFCPFFCILGGGVCCVRFFVVFLFERNENQKIKLDTAQPKKQDHKTQTRKSLSLVYKKVDSTDTKQCNFIV